MATLRILRAAACVCVTLTSAPGVGEAQGFKLRGAAGLKLDVEYTRFDDPDNMSVPADTVVGGIDLWGTIGTALQYFAAIDVHFGGAVNGGFAYEMDFYGFGLGIQLGSFAFAGVAAGIGFSGVTGEIPFARQFPIRGILQLNLHKRLHIEGFAIGKAIGARARNNGTDAFGGFDEIKAGVLLRIGKGGGNAYQRWGNGYFVGATYSELLGVRSYGALLGYSISIAYDMGGRWRKRYRPYMPRVRPTKVTPTTVTPDEL